MAAVVAGGVAEEVGMQAMISDAHSKIMSIITPKRISYIILVIVLIVCAFLYWFSYRQAAISLFSGVAIGYGTYYLSTFKPSV